LILAADLLLPGLVDGHMHLDETLMGLPWMPDMAGPSRVSRIGTDKRVLPYLPAFTEERADYLIEAYVARGTAHLRTNVDFDLDCVEKLRFGALRPVCCYFALRCFK
jgi:cytosine/adenosine deaminase-related metal-dependent hydrolase